MNLEGKDEQLLRKYLLGELSEPDQQAFEGRLLTDDELYDLLLAEEDELVDDYLGGELSERECEAFNSYFLSTPERQRKLSFGEALKRYKPHVVPKSASEDPKQNPTTKEPGVNEPIAKHPKGKDPEVKDPGVKESASRVPPTVLPSPSPVVIGPTSWWSRTPSTPYFKIAATVLIALGLVGTWRGFFYRSPVGKGMAALAQAYRNERPTEARISGFNYAPYPNTRGTEEGKVDTTSRNLAEITLLEEVAKHPRPPAHHALGQLYLAKREYKLAIEQFETALKDEPTNAELHGDYGAALLELGKANRKIDDGSSEEHFARSLEHLDVALDLDSSLLGPLFNRALCHQYMRLQSLAKEDWLKYLEKDSNSQWADEARDRLKELTEQREKVSKNEERTIEGFLIAYEAKDNEKAWMIISQNRGFQGSLIENRLLDDYLEHSNEGQTLKAADRLRILSYAAGSETVRAGDPYLSKLIRFYKSTSALQKLELAKARGLMRQGHNSFNKFGPQVAEDLYRRARNVFVREGNHYEAAYTNYLQGHCLLSKHKNEAALSIFHKVVVDCEAQQYRWLLAQTLNAIANAHTSRRDFSLAISESKQFLEISEEIGDTNGVIKAVNQLANEYYYVHNYSKSLALYSRALALADVCSPTPLDLWRNYYSIARVFNNIGLNAAATDYQKEALQTAIQAGLTQLVCRSYCYLGELYGNQRNFDKATESIQEALKIGESLSDSAARADTVAFSALQLAYVNRQAGDLDKAIANYDLAIQLYRETDSKYFDFVSRKERLVCCMAGGGCPNLEHEIERTLELYEEQRSQILEDSNRSTFFEAEQDIYDLAIDFQYSMKKDVRRAFEYSEICRARSLRDLASTSIRLINEVNNPEIVFKTVSQPMDTATIRGRLPESSQILQYSVLKDKLLSWVISKKEVYCAVSHVSLLKLDEMVRDYLRRVSSKSEAANEETSRKAKELYDLLIKPVEPALDTGLLVCIVPDKILNRLPFSALVFPGTEEYLIERYDLVFSPSSSMFIICSDAAREKHDSRIESLLSVGNPLFDARKFPYLADLPEAVSEAEEIARFYSTSRSISGPSATKERVRKDMEKSDVIHLALHCVVDEWSPLRSKLLLAKVREASEADASDGALEAYEIYNLNLTRARLVILSACKTAVERYQGGEGIGISRPFIAGGVPLVVASLWSVDSKSTAELMIDFHKHRKTEGLRTTEALRRAQRDMIAGDFENHRSPYYWAPFVTVGGYAEF
jgi:CHAT domain-containing protein